MVHYENENSILTMNISILIVFYFCSFSDRPSTPQTSAPATNHTNTMNANMQSPRQNTATATKEPVPSNNLIRNNSGGIVSQKLNHMNISDIETVSYIETDTLNDHNGCEIVLALALSLSLENVYYN